MRGLVAALLLSALLAASPEARAQGKSDEAKARFKQGQIHYNLDEWDHAIREFKEAYRLHPDAIFLYNIGQCYRKKGEPGEALSYYKKYLRASPNAPNRAEVQRRIEELEALAAAGDKAREAPPPNVLPPRAASPTEPAASPVAAAPAAAGPPPPPPALMPTPPPPAGPPAGVVSAGPESTAEAEAVATPLYRRWWFWTAAGAVAAGALVVGVIAAGGKTTPGYQGSLDPGRIVVASP